MFLARGDEPEEAGFAECCGGLGWRGMVVVLVGGEDGGKEDSDGLSGGPEGEGGCYSLPPELVAHAADLRRGGGVRDADEFKVEGADGKMCGAEAGREEGAENVGGVVILPALLMLAIGDWEKGSAA